MVTAMVAGAAERDSVAAGCRTAEGRLDAARPRVGAPEADPRQAVRRTTAYPTRGTRKSGCGTGSESLCNWRRYHNIRWSALLAKSVDSGRCLPLYGAVGGADRLGGQWQAARPASVNLRPAIGTNSHSYASE